MVNGDKYPHSTSNQGSDEHRGRSQDAINKRPHKTHKSIAAATTTIRPY